MRRARGGGRGARGKRWKGCDAHSRSRCAEESDWRSDAARWFTRMRPNTLRPSPMLTLPSPSSPSSIAPAGEQRTPRPLKPTDRQTDAPSAVPDPAAGCSAAAEQASRQRHSGAAAHKSVRKASSAKVVPSSSSNSSWPNAQRERTREKQSLRFTVGASQFSANEHELGAHELLIHLIMRYVNCFRVFDSAVTSTKRNQRDEASSANQPKGQARIGCPPTALAQHPCLGSGAPTSTLHCCGTTPMRWH